MSLPALVASTTMRLCQWSGTAATMQSMFLSSSRRRYSRVVGRLAPAISFARVCRPSYRSAAAAQVTPGSEIDVPSRPLPCIPTPIIPKRTVSLGATRAPGREALPAIVRPAAAALTSRNSRRDQDGFFMGNSPLGSGVSRQLWRRFAGCRGSCTPNPPEELILSMFPPPQLRLHCRVYLCGDFFVASQQHLLGASMTSTERPMHGTARDAGEHYDPHGFPRQLLAALLEFRDGNFAVRMPSGLTGLDGKLADTFNDIASNADRRARDVARVSRMVGKEGVLKERLNVTGMIGTRADEVAAINTLIDDLVWPTIEVTRAVGAVAKGDLTQSMSLEVNGRPLEGEFLHSAKLVNTMIDQLSVFTAEVTRVAREVGTEGKLGGQAKVKGVSGVWKDLTESVNQMAGNLTAQVRNIADVTVSVASGDLSKKITVDVRGEILQLKEAINTMVDQLRSFAAEVTRVAREVGTDGKLGGQAVVPGAAGTWKDLTDSVNAMASNLTAQVRNIAAVTTAVARGDLSRKITVDVKGEILELKDTINTMVDQLNAFASEVSRVAREVGTDGK